MAIPNPTHYWSLSTRGQAEDTAPGGSSDGTISGAVHTVSGKIRGAYDFDGTDDYVIKTGASFLGDTSGSVSIWVNLDTYDNLDTIWSVADTGGGTKFFQIVLTKGGTGVNDDRIRIIHYDGGYSYQLISPANGLLGLTGWHHFVITSNGSTIKAYIDGSEVTLTVNDGSNNGDWFGDISGLDNFVIGALVYNTSPTIAQSYNGELCEVGIWDSALSSTEVTELYNSGSGKFWNQVTEEWEAQDSLRNGLIAAYNFNGDALDDAGSNDGTISGATLTGSGLSAQAYDFDGTNDDINIPADIPSTPYSLSFWIKHDALPSASSWDFITGGVNNKYAMNFGIYNNGGTAQFGFATNASDSYMLTNFPSYSNSSFFHIVLVVSGSTKYVYVNGSSTSASISGTAQTDTGFYLGKRNDGFYFDGLIDEVGVWDRALTSTEVSTLYNGGTGKVFDKETQTFIDGDEKRIGLAGYYGLDNNSLDHTINNNDGATTGTSTYFTGTNAIAGSCVACAGSESTEWLNNFTTGYGEGIALGTQSLSWGGWIKVPSNGIALSFGTGAGTNQRYYVGSNSNSQWGVGYKSTGYTSDPGASTAVDYNTWTHVMVTSEAGTSVILKLYIDGGLDHTINAGSGWTTVGDLGFSNYLSSEYTTGTSFGFADELGLWDRVLSSTEVSELYNQGTGLAYPFVITEAPAEGWSGIISGVTNPSRIIDILTTALAKVNGVE